MNILFYVFAMLVICWGKLALNKNRTLTMDIAQATKGSASLLIMIGHVCKAYKDPLHVFPVGWLGVALFFFWSGYGLMYGYKHKTGYLVNFWKSRLTKILIPFMTAAFIYTPIKWLLGDNGPYTGIDGGIFVDYSWYVFSLLLFTFCFYVCFRHHDKESIRPYLWLTFCILVVSVLYDLLGLADIWYYSNLMFVIGVVICSFDENLKYRKHYLLLCPICAFIFFLIHPAFQRVFGFYSEIVRTISNNGTSAAASLLIVVTMASVYKPNRLSLLLGKNSYEIYLLHGLVLSMLYKLHLYDDFYVIASLTVVMTVAIAIPMHRLNKLLISRIL